MGRNRLSSDAHPGGEQLQVLLNSVIIHANSQIDEDRVMNPSDANQDLNQQAHTTSSPSSNEEGTSNNQVW